MNNFSPLPAAASDPRLSSPEGVAPNTTDPALKARQQKLRRVVAWVVGAASLLMCAGLLRAATRSHAEPAEVASPNATPQALAIAPPPLSTQGPPTQTQAVVPPPPSSASLPSNAVAKPVKKAHATILHTPKPAAKTSKHSAVIKSAVARH